MPRLQAAALVSFRGVAPFGRINISRPLRPPYFKSDIRFVYLIEIWKASPVDLLIQCQDDVRLSTDNDRPIELSAEPIWNQTAPGPA